MRGNFDLFWARATRVASFFLGCGIMVYETVADSSDRPWLYAAAVGLCGLPVARAAESVLGKLGGNGPQEPPDRPVTKADLRREIERLRRQGEDDSP